MVAESDEHLTILQLQKTQLLISRMSGGVNKIDLIVWICRQQIENLSLDQTYILHPYAWYT